MTSSIYYASTPSRTFITGENLTISQTLPPGVRRLDYNAMAGRFELVNMSPIDLPKKIYGKADSLADRFITRFDKLGTSMGVMLTGEKGSGKSILLKLLAHRVVEKGGMALVVDFAAGGSEYGEFLQKIPQGSVIMYDEADKIYEKEEAFNGLLPILDGATPSRHLHVFSSNKPRLNNFLTNRPSRILYHLEYDGLTDDEILEYCNDALEDKSHLDAIMGFVELHSSFNFDMLIKLVDELNTVGGDFDTAVEILNVKPSMYQSPIIVSVNLEYKGEVLMKDETLRIDMNKPSIFIGAHILDDKHPRYREVVGKEEDGWGLQLGTKDISTYKPRQKLVVWKSGDFKVIARESIIDPTMKTLV
jgi:energy-coupling factor transporter ATP-binding protein EcfA2